MTAIETNGLTKRFGEDVFAVKGLDLTVHEGEVFGFLGPNGAGKSTVINMLLDFVRPTAGSATVLGHDPTREAEAIRRRTGVLPEGGRLYERLTGVEHIRWKARAHDVDSDPAELLRRVGLSTAAADRAVGGYSKGMRQRLAFAMALVGDPELLILDEPSSGLDPTGMREFRELVRNAAADGTTVFFSSHILGQVEAVCDRVGILNDGRLVETGTPVELKTALGLGSSISVEVSSTPTDHRLDHIDGVRSVTIDGSTVAATLTEPEAKGKVVSRLADRTRVRDIHIEDTSLEQLFDAYTSGDVPHRPPSETEHDVAAVEVSR